MTNCLWTLCIKIWPIILKNLDCDSLHNFCHIYTVTLSKSKQLGLFTQWWTQWKSWEVSFITSSLSILQNGKKIQIAYPKHRNKQKGTVSSCASYATGIFFQVWSTCSIQKLYNCFHYSRNTMKILETKVRVI